MRTLLLLILSAFGLCAQVEHGLLVNLMTRPAAGPSGIPTNILFTSDMGPLRGTNWGVLSAGLCSNNPTWQTNFIRNSGFTSTNYWDMAGSTGMSIDTNLPGMTFTNVASTISATASSIPGPSFEPKYQEFLPGQWFKWTVGISAAASGYFVLFNGDNTVSYFRSWPPEPLNKVGTWSGSYTRPVTMAGIRIQNGYSDIATGVVSTVQMKGIRFNELFATANFGSADLSISTKILNLNTNEVAGLILRLNMEKAAIVIGDSKCNQNYLWYEQVLDPVFIGDNVAYYTGLRVEEIATNFVYTNMYERWFIPDIALLAGGVNNNDMTLAQSNVAFNAYDFTLTSIKSNWPSIKCYLAHVWGSDGTNGAVRDCTMINQIVDQMLTNHSDFCYAGQDERTWYNDGPVGHLGTTYTIDGLHPNAAGVAMMAQKWNAAIGNEQTNPQGAANSIIVAFNRRANCIQVFANDHGTNTTVRTTGQTWNTNSLLCASVNGTKLKVFYGGTIVGACDTVAQPHLQSGLNFGLFSTDPGTLFNQFNVSNSTSSTTEP